MATIYLNNNTEIWTDLTIEELKKIQVNSKDFIEIEFKQIIQSEYSENLVKHEKKYLINVKSISYIEERISNYISNEESI